MRSSRWHFAVSMLAAMAPALPQAAADPGVQLASRPNESFATIQSAIDAAQTGDVVEIPAGRFDERLTFSKPIELVGAGAHHTIIGPTAEGQAALREKMEQFWQALDQAAREAEAADAPEVHSDAEIAELTRKFEEIKRLDKQYRQPVVHIVETAGVKLRSLKVTMPDTPREDQGLTVAGAVMVERGGVRIEDCAVVGCLSSGIRGEDGASIEVVDCLVAACWDAGVSMPYGGGFLISNSDIRNNYHYNITAGSPTGVIEDCRISGSAWSGFKGVAARIERNAIFDNARSGIYSAGENASVKHNLFYRNDAGASCWSSAQPIYEGNLFLDNDAAAFYASGPCEPAINGNLIVGSPLGVCYGPSKVTKGVRPAAAEFHVTGNVFWQVETPVVLRKGLGADAPLQPIPLADEPGNRVAEAQATIGPERRVVFAADSPAHELDMAPVKGLSLDGRWPLTPEEQAMIPDDGTRDSSKWKKRPEERAAE